MANALYTPWYQFDPAIMYLLTVGRFKAEPGSGRSPNIVAVRFQTQLLEGDEIIRDGREAKVLIACGEDWWPLEAEFADCIRRILPERAPKSLQWSLLLGRSVLGRFGDTQPGGRNPLMEMRLAPCELASVPNRAVADCQGIWPELDESRFAIRWRGYELPVGDNDMFRFLKMLIEARGCPVRYADFGETIFGDQCVSPKTIHSLKRHVKNKLESNPHFAPLAAGIRPSRGHYRFEL